MSAPAITIKQLRAFESVVLSGCKRKHSARVSVGRFERAVGVKLFKQMRDGSRCLSKDGSAVFSRAVKILVIVDFLQAGGAVNSKTEDAA